METNDEINRTRHLLNRNFRFGEHLVSAEELEILAITPEELFHDGNNETTDGSINITDHRFWQEILPRNLYEQSVRSQQPYIYGSANNFDFRIEFQNGAYHGRSSSSSGSNYSADGHESYSSAEDISSGDSLSESSGSSSSSTNSMSSDISPSSVSTPSFWNGNDGNISSTLSSSSEISSGNSNMNSIRSTDEQIENPFFYSPSSSSNEDSSSSSSS